MDIWNLLQKTIRAFDDAQRLMEFKKKSLSSANKFMLEIQREKKFYGDERDFEITKRITVRKWNWIENSTSFMK